MLQKLPPVIQKIIRGFNNETDLSRYVSHIVISVILGIAAGAGAVLFHFLLEKMRQFFEPGHFTGLFNVSGNYIFIIPVIGGIVLVVLTRMFSNIASERGVISSIRALVINNGFIPLKVTLFHLVTPIIAIGTGHPLGPEGPAAKLGSGIGSFMSQVFRLEKSGMKMYTAAGAGAAISAVFNAPITGVFFGIEVMLLNDSKNQALSALIVSSVVADIVSRAFLGNQHIISIPSGGLGSLGEYHFFLLMGIVSGLVSIFYFRIKKSSGILFNDKMKNWNEYTKLIPVCIIFGIVLMKYYQLFGLGYDMINEVLSGKFTLQTVLVLLFLKTVFLALFLAAGSYGGTFAPALGIGVLLGFSFATVCNSLAGTNLDPVTFALVGMGGMLAGLNSVPLASIMLVFEITNDYKFILPLMLVSIISYLVSTYYNKGTIYARGLQDFGIDVSRRSEVDILGKIRVKDLMSSDFTSVNYKTPFSKVMEELLKSEYGDVVVVDSEMRSFGVISLRDIRQVLLSNELVELLIAQDIVSPAPPVTLDDPVSLAVQKLEEYDMENVPVIENRESQKVIGFLSHHDIIQAYNRMLREWEEDQLFLYGKSFD